MRGADSLTELNELPAETRQDGKWNFYRICNQLVAEQLSSGLDVEVDQAIQALHQGSEDWGW
jgi:hypothetical protein